MLGTAAGYLASYAWFRSSTLNGGASALASVPVAKLLIILIGMPLFAAVIGWAARGTRAARHQPPADGVTPGAARRYGSGPASSAAASPPSLEGAVGSPRCRAQACHARRKCQAWGAMAIASKMTVASSA